MEVYLDNSSTTKIREEVLREIIDINENYYANPSSIHRMGLEIEKKINLARKSAAKVINAREDEIFFTSGGTESNNIAIFGQVNINDKNCNVITTKLEHSSVFNVFRHLEKYINVKYAPVDENGMIIMDKLINQVDENTSLLSLSHVNNETGTIQDIQKIARTIKSKNKYTKIHIDAVQSFGKLKINTHDLDVNTISFSSHKIHGPKGVGGLYIRKGSKVNPIIFGGSQEKGIRSGTEDSAGIVGFGIACDLLNEELIKRLNELKLAYAKRITEEIEDVKINSLLNDEGVCHILNVSFKNVKGEALVHLLEAKGIFVSTTSACSQKTKHNRVLKELNIDKSFVDGTIRISLGYYNNADEIDYVVENIKNSVQTIRKLNTK